MSTKLIESGFESPLFKSSKHKELTSNANEVFWLWFPIGSCGVRTVLLFISSLTIFVLRVSQMHIGARTASSSFGNLKFFSLLQIAQTFGWYIFSAWWFTQIYVWSSSGDSNLELVKRGRCVRYPNESKPRLTNTDHMSDLLSTKGPFICIHSMCS